MKGKYRTEKWRQGFQNKAGTTKAKNWQCLSKTMELTMWTTFIHKILRVAILNRVCFFFLVSAAWGGKLAINTLLCSRNYCLHHTTSTPVRVCLLMAFSSTQERNKCTWRNLSSKEILLLHARRPSSICARCPPAFASRQENISLYPPLLSPTRMATSICGSFQRNRLTSSKPLTQKSTNFEKRKIPKKCCEMVWWCDLCFFQRDWRSCGLPRWAGDFVLSKYTR